MLRKAFIFVALAILAFSVWEGWRVLGPAGEPPVWERYSGFGLKRPASMPLSPPRTWTDVSGRSIEAVATGADDERVQLRVLSTQTVHTLPLSRLSDEDRSFVAKWRRSRPKPAPPGDPLPTRWPHSYDQPGAAPLAESEAQPGTGFVWLTPNYEIRSTARIDEDSLRAIATISESIDGACRAAPLPLLWGRPEQQRRIILVAQNDEEYEAAGGAPGSAGVFNPANGVVMVSAPALRSSDFLGMARGFTLEKRQRYSVLVHELVHQATHGIVLAGFPAWVPEGIAEYFSAVQRNPGRFQFRDSHLAVRAHVAESLSAGGLVQFDRYPVWSLEHFLDRDLAEWNRISAAGIRDGAGQLQYFQALVLVEYFCRADSPEGSRFRSYLEAVLTGAPPREAASLHLLAGRSHAQLESALAAYWRPRGLALAFSDSPSLGDVELRPGLGLDSKLRR